MSTFFYGLLTGVALSVVAYLLRAKIRGMFISDLQKAEKVLNPPTK